MERAEQRPREIIDVRVLREEEFPSDPEARFEAVFSAIGNSEAKCLTLLCLEQSVQTGWELHRRFLEASRRVWKTNRKLQANYCLKTLVPIGLVAEVDSLYDGVAEYVVGFRLTEAGRKYGQPAAVFLLEKSKDLPYSLNKIFGQTARGRGETRSVLNRAAILSSLAKNPREQRTVDIAGELGLEPTIVGSHLEHLSCLGLVDYQSVSTEEKGYASYELLKRADFSRVKSVRTLQNLTREVYRLLLELKAADAGQLAEILKSQFPKSKIATLKSEISRVLSGLSRQGVCQPQLFVGGKIQSRAEISKLGAQIAQELILPIKQALADDQRLLANWQAIPWQNFTAELIAKYKETSVHANSQARQEWMDKAMTIIAQNPGARPGEIQTLLGRNTTDLLRILLEEGKVRKERQGKAVRYFPTDQT